MQYFLSVSFKISRICVAVFCLVVVCGKILLSYESYDVGWYMVLFGTLGPFVPVGGFFFWEVFVGLFIR